jgi:iron complex transport system ATP-binding protein
MPGSEKILTLENLSIGFISGKRKTVIIPPLWGSAAKGEMIAIIGKNGIGKSTLLRTIAGIQKPLSGNILYYDKSKNELTQNDLAKIAAYVSTEPVKVSNMSVYDLVSLGRYPYTNWYGSISPDDDRIVVDAMQQTRVAPLSRRFIAELSDGERQKAMIARMLAQDTPVMLMDEPTSFLDIESRFAVFHLLLHLSHECGKTIIYTTHDLQLAAGHSDKIWLMSGSGMQEGAPEDLMLDGYFENLFSSPAVEFNILSGTYSLKINNRGDVYVEGEGVIRLRTMDAVKRAGFSVSESKTDLYIKAGPGKRWSLISKEFTLEFSSLYDTVNKLTEIR